MCSNCSGVNEWERGLEPTKTILHEDPQATFFCDQHDFLVATDALFSKGDKRISCCGNLISTLISGQKT